MKLCLSIDALSVAGDQAWRLQQDDSWRNCRFAEPLQQNDARITDKTQAEGWAGRRMKKDKEKVLVPLEKPGIFDFLMRGTFAHAVMHRLSPAPLPDRAQMLTCIRDHAPGKPWLLYLDTGANFRAMDTTQARIIHNMDIAVRGEIASSANYIGPKAIEDANMMQELWQQFLAGWLEHLRTSKMGVFVPDPQKLPEEADIMVALEAWLHEPDIQEAV